MGLTRARGRGRPRAAARSPSVYAVLAASLPRRGGEAALPGLAAPLAVTLDARAIATVRGESFLDVLRGQGYLHAQERFFQMDLLRRSSAGELAELFGERALAADRGQRPFGYREHARGAARGAAGRAESRGSTLTRRASTRASRTWARGRPSTGSPAPRRAPWLPEDSLLVVLDVLHDALEQRLVRARAGRHARRAARRRSTSS